MNNIGAFLVSLLLSTNAIEQQPYRPETYRRCSGDVFQLIDNNGKEIIPSKFSEITSVGHGLLRTRSIDANDPYMPGKEFSLFTKDGVEIKPVLPKGATFYRMFWFGKAADKDPQLVLDRLPDDAIVQFLVDDKSGLCNTRGDILVAPNLFSVGDVRDGVAFLALNGGDAMLYKPSTNELRPLKIKSSGISYVRFNEGLAPFHDTSSNTYGYLSPDGKVVIKPVFQTAQPFSGGFAV